MRPIRMGLLYRFVLCVTWCYFKLFYSYRVYGLSHFPKGGAILAANHVSFYDPPLVSVSSIEEVHFLARKSLFKRLFGSFIRALNAHPLSGDVGSIGVIRSITDLLKRGKKVVLFPEGKRSFTGELSEIKPGISLLISKTGAAIVPVYIAGAYDVWPRRRKRPKLGGRLACIFGTPIRWEAFADLPREEASRAVSTRLTESLLALKTWYEAGAQGTPP